MGEATLVEAHSPSPLPAPNSGVDHLDPIDIVDILRWDAQGLTQVEIAAKFNPPRSQSTISRCLRKYGTDTTTEAKRIFAAGAATAAIKILAEGRPSDLIKVQEGQNVLAQTASSGLVIQIGGGSGDVKVAVFAPSNREVERRSSESLSITQGSDNASYVNQD